MLKHDVYAQGRFATTKTLVPVHGRFAVQSRRGVPRPYLVQIYKVSSIFDRTQDDRFPNPLPPREREPCSEFG